MKFFFSLFVHLCLKCSLINRLFLMKIHFWVLKLFFFNWKFVGLYQLVIYSGQVTSGSFLSFETFFLSFEICWFISTNIYSVSVHHLARSVFIFSCLASYSSLSKSFSFSSLGEFPVSPTSKALSIQPFFSIYHLGLVHLFHYFTAACPIHTRANLFVLMNP